MMQGKKGEKKKMGGEGKEDLPDGGHKGGSRVSPAV